MKKNIIYIILLFMLFIMFSCSSIGNKGTAIYKEIYAKGGWIGDCDYIGNYSEDGDDWSTLFSVTNNNGEAIELSTEIESGSYYFKFKYYYIDDVERCEVTKAKITIEADQTYIYKVNKYGKVIKDDLGLVDAEWEECESYYD